MASERYSFSLTTFSPSGKLLSHTFSLLRVLCSLLRSFSSYRSSDTGTYVGLGPVPFLGGVWDRNSIYLETSSVSDP